MKKTYTGGCHCGAVRFEADLDLDQSTYRCNCSICSRTRFWPAIASRDGFRLLQGESELTEYLFHSRQNRHFFCKHCGVRSFGRGDSPEAGGVVGVNVTCLDGVTPEELDALPITYVDGKNDRSSERPAHWRYL